MSTDRKKRIIVGATGASGIPVLIKCLELIRESGYESYLIMSHGARLTLACETNFSEKDVEALADYVLEPFGIEAKEYRRWKDC